MFRTGAVNEPLDQIWISSFVADFLKEGTPTRTAKRQARAAMLLEWPGLNRAELDAILKRHDLTL